MADAHQHDGENPLRKPLLQQQNGGQASAAANGHSSKAEHQHTSTVLVQLKRLVFLALPLVAQNVSTLSLPVISNISVGHLNDPTMLSAALLGSSFFMVTGWSVLMALSTAQDTIVGQAHGARNYTLVGLTLQRGILVAWSLCVPMVLLWWNAAPVLSALGIPPAIVVLTAHYLRMLSPTIFSVAVVANLQRWLVSQRIVHIASTSVVIAALLAPFYNWLLIHRLGLGMGGAASAFFAAFTTYAVVMVILTVFHIRKLQGPAAQVWGGFSRQALSNWGHYLSYGIPAAIMICCELWVGEAMLFMNGFLPNAEISVAVMGLTQNISSLTIIVMASVGIACSTMIANALGAGHLTEARNTFFAGASVALGVQAVLVTPLYLLRDQVPLLFTHAPEVVELASHTLPVVALSLLASGVTSVFSGVLRGIGRQKWGALLNLAAYWVVGLPTSITLGVVYRFGPVGFWLGLVAANWVQLSIQAAVLFRLNWQTEVARAQALVAARHHHHHHHHQGQGQGQQGQEQEDVKEDHGGHGLDVEHAVSIGAEGAAAVLDTTGLSRAGSESGDDSSILSTDNSLTDTPGGDLEANVVVEDSLGPKPPLQQADP